MESKIVSEIEICKSLIETNKEGLERARKNRNDWVEGFYSGSIQSLEFFIDRLNNLLADYLLEGANHERND